MATSANAGRAEDDGLQVEAKTPCSATKYWIN